MSRHPGCTETVSIGDGPEPVVRYLAIGDSIARGFRLGLPHPWRRDPCAVSLFGVPLRWFDRVEDAYPTVLATMIAERLGRPVILDRSGTCSGARIDKMIQGKEPSAAVGQAVTQRPDLVTITLGANDVLEPWYGYVVGLSLARPLGTLLPGRLFRAAGTALAPSRERVTAEVPRLVEGLEEMLGFLRESLPAAVIAITTYFSGDGSPEVTSRFVVPLNGAIREAADRVPEIVVVPLDDLFQGHRVHEGDGVRWVTITDGVHPTSAGQRAIAGRILGAVLPRLAAAYEPASVRSNPGSPEAGVRL